MNLRTLAFRYLSRQRLKTMLIVISISLGAALLSASQVFLASIEKSNELSIQSVYGDVDLYVGYQLSIHDELRKPLTEEDLKNLESLTEVRQIGTIHYPYLGYEEEYEMWDDIYVGFNEEPLAYESTMVDIGEQTIPAEREVIVSRAYASIHDVAIGDNIDLLFPPGEKEQVKIVGYSNEDREDLSSVLLFQAEWLQSVTRKGPTMAMLQLDSHESKQSVHDQIVQMNPLLNVDLLEETNDLRENVGGLLPILTSINIAVIIVSGLLYRSIMEVMIQERNQQLAVLRLVGASKRNLLFLACIETLFVSIVSLFIGLVIGICTALMILSAPMTFADVMIVTTEIPWLSIGFYLLLYVASLFIFSVFPVYQASNVSPISTYQQSSSQLTLTRKRVRLFIVLLVCTLILSILSFVTTDVWLHVLSMFSIITLYFVCITHTLRFALRFVHAIIQPLRHSSVWTLAPLQLLRHLQKTKAIAMLLSACIILTTLGFTTLENLKQTSIDQLFSLNPADFRVTSYAYGNYALQNQGFSPELYDEITLQNDVSEPSNYFTTPFIGLTTNLPKTTWATEDVDGTAQVLAQIKGTDLHPYLEEARQGKTTINELDPFDVVITERTADALGYEIGDQINLKSIESDEEAFNYSFTVASIVSNHPFLSNEQFEPFDSFFMTPKQMDDHFAITQHSELLLSSANRQAEQQIHGTIESLQLENDVNVINRYAALEEFQEQYNERLYVLAFTIGIMIVLTMAGLFTSSMSTFQARLTELSILRSIGLFHKQLYRILLLEGALLTFISALMASVCSLWLSMHLTFSLQGSLSVLPVTELTIIIVLSPVLGILGFLLPTRWALRQNILKHLT
ncbi:hypothetical protein JCM19037_4056 [Geomicrobium sp. JCM 19037]|uniref:ABC transporter permease n=1 Tax=Geomicrobium sp. JCM 19037 TaxID=1460634 RepID=UPI00045F3B7B|nr:ABC transporter permease [Geomicrobium sp. JCM 19037]GAK05550.1 hypothetical protein JCM19037_4056 [Geomicrobium sp. JCM 19037]